MKNKINKDAMSIKKSADDILTYISDADFIDTSDIFRMVMAESPLGLLYYNFENDKISFFNKMFINVWKIEYLIDNLSSGNITFDELFTNLTTLINKPGNFSQSFSKCKNDNKYEDAYRLKDGKMLWQYSAPVTSGEKIIGRIFFYKDISTMDSLHVTLQENLHWQEIITSIAALLNGASFTENERFQGILSIIGNHFSFDRTALVTVNDFENSKYSYIWSSDKAPKVTQLSEYQSSLIKFTEYIVSNRVILTYEENEQKVYPALIQKAFKSFIDMGYKSFVFIPLFSTSEYIGVLFGGSFNESIKFEEKTIERLGFISEIISGSLIKTIKSNEIKKSQELFSLAFEENPSSLVIITINDRTILDINKSCLSLLNYLRDEVINISTLELGMWNTTDDLERILSTFNSENQVFKDKIKIRTKISEVKVVSLNARKIEISGDDCILATLTDETYNEKLHTQLRLMEASIAKFDVPVFWVRSDGVIIYANDAACKHLGYTSREMTHLYIWQIDAVINEEHWLNIKWPKLCEIKEYHGETRQRRKNGTIVPVETHESYIEFDNEQYLFTIVEDITERMRIDNALLSSTRAWHAISECNQAVVRGVDEEELINDICKILVDVGGYKIAWVGYNNSNKDDRRLVPISIYGEDEDFFKSIYWHDDETGDAEMNIGSLSVQPVIIRNVFTEPTKVSFREELIRRGFVSTAAFPIIIDGLCIGYLNIAGTKINIFDNDEVELLTELSNDLSYGISTIRIRKEKVIAMQALQKERDQAQKYLDIAGVMILALDINGNILMLNKKGYDLLGYQNDELIGKNWFETIIPESICTEMKNIFFNLMINENELNSIQENENPVLTASGSERIISFKNNYIKNEKGEIIGLLSSGEDVTNIRRAEKKHQLMLKTAPDGFSVIEYPSGHIIEVNDAYVDMLGYTEEELLKLNIKDIEAHFDKSSLKMLLKHIVDSGSDRFISRLRKKDGIILDVEVSANYDNANHCFLIFTRDISDRIRSEAQMLQAAKMESVGRLAGGVAHDFNNIMTGILGQASLTIGEVKTEKTKNRMKEIIELSERASNLTRQLLTFSRKQTIEMVPVDLNALIKDAIKMLSRLVREDVAIHFKPAQHICAILADVGQMEQILMNLAVNAKDAMPNGGDLYISTKNSIIDSKFVIDNPGSTEGEYVCFTVRDTGEGMDKFTLENIFIPFFTTKDTGQGTGLGLATVYGIVKKHNGYIKVDSTINGGTTFNVYIPCQSDFAPLVSNVKIASPALIFKGQGRETILVVEDEISVRKTVTAVLNHAGYIVLAAATPSEARDIFNKEHDKIDMMLTDIIMPEENGVELYRSFSMIKPNLPVVFMSGYSDGLLHSNLQPGETFQMLAKPFRPHDLLNRVRSVLENSDGEK
jgi:two-component system cell cycle sensor histidine kinase/response regulator CckA